MRFSMPFSIASIRSRLEIPARNLTGKETIPHAFGGKGHRMPQSDFKDNVVILTGASSGIGKELALLLAGQGARLTLGARNEQALNAVAAECRARGAAALVVLTDVTDPAQCRQLIDQTIQAY